MSDREGWIAVTDIDFNDFNPNQMTPEKKVALKESIKKDGIMQNVIVRPKGNRFEMIDGQNRTEIAKELKIHNLKATIKDVNDLEAMKLCYKMNADRGQLDAFKEAVFFDLLAQKGMLLPSVASEYQVSEQFIKDRIKLLSINTEQKEMMLKKIGKNVELTGAHWLAYAKASPEAKIEITKSIRKDDDLKVRDIEHYARRAEEEIKRRKEFEEILEKTEFKTCPKCKGKAVKLDWQKHLECAEYHDWDPKTGKTSQQVMGGTYNKTEKVKKPKFRRNLEIEIDWPMAYKDAQEFVLKNLGEINSVSFTDKNKKEWNLSISRSKDYGHITIRREHETEFQLVRNYRGKDGSSVCGPAAGEITKKDHEGMLALVKQFKGKVIEKSIVKKKAKTKAKKGKA